MENFSILLPDGKAPGSADFDGAMSDLGLIRLCSILFPDMSPEGGREYSARLLTDSREVLEYRHELLGELLEKPELISCFEKALEYAATIKTCSDGIRDNAKGLTAGDVAFDGLKGFIDGLEKLLSRNSSAVFEDLEPNNYYAQFVRASIFSWENIRAYVSVMELLTQALSGHEFKSRGLRRLKEWVEAQCREDKIEASRKKLDEIAKWWSGIAGFSVDICLNQALDLESLELSSIQVKPYMATGMLDRAASGGYDGITSLSSIPQGGMSVQFQEYLLCELGMAAHKELNKLRNETTRLPIGGRLQLLALGDELPFYICAAKLAQRLRDAGFAVCRPEFSESHIIDAKGAYLTELALYSDAPPVSNDISLPAGGTINLITGANSSGKTTYIITAGQLQWLFQLGCFLPAESAKLRTVDALHTIFASGESDTAEDSRMGLEVIKIAQAKERMSGRSMVLLNEPMTSTSASEGIEICIDLLCELIGRGVSGMMVTHYNEIYSMSQPRLAAASAEEKLKSYVMAVEKDGEGLVYTYRLVQSPPGKSSYAYAVVSRLGVTLEAMLARMEEGGAPVRADDPVWARLHGEEDE